MCDVPRCRQEDTEMMYYGKRICHKHAEEHYSGKINLKQVFSITDAPIKKEHTEKQERLKA